MQDSMTIKEASIWVSKYIGKNVTPSSISFLIQMTFSDLLFYESL